MIKKGTRFYTPDTLSELKEIIYKEQEVKLLAGGTSLFRKINGDTLVLPGVIILLENIPELTKENRTERYFEFGSMITIQNIIDNCKRNFAPVLIDALEKNAPFPVRNISTIGAAIANNDIKSDLLPLFYVFNVKVEVINLRDKKIKARWESLTQYLSTQDNRGLHLITRVRIPLINPAYYQYFKTGFKYNLFNEISFAAIADLEKGNISSLSMAFNINNKKIIRTKDIDAELIGKHIPIGLKSREALIQTFNDNLNRIEGLEDYQKFQMIQIILHFLEAF
ncbi:MAG: FAD binding domain-containing protein [Spirochaetales bacterium]|nr:FAD binding domain-containing protein [Spirochaetales bacterium]